MFTENRLDLGLEKRNCEMCDSSFLCSNDEKSFSEVWKLVVAVSLETSVLASFAIQTHFNGFAKSDVKQITALCKLCKNSL